MGRKKTHFASALAGLKRFSIRKIAETLEISRSNLMQQLNKPHSLKSYLYFKAADEQVLVLIKKVIKDRPTYGYRRVHAIVNGKLKAKQLPVINPQRVFRLMRQQRLLLQRPNRHLNEPIQAR